MFYLSAMAINRFWVTIFLEEFCMNFTKNTCRIGQNLRSHTIRGQIEPVAAHGRVIWITLIEGLSTRPNKRDALSSGPKQTSRRAINASL